MNVHRGRDHTVSAVRVNQTKTDRPCRVFFESQFYRGRERGLDFTYVNQSYIL